MSEREIEKNEALARIKGLENELANGWQWDRIKVLEERVEALENALKAVSSEVVLTGHLAKFVEAALAPETEK